MAYATFHNLEETPSLDRLTPDENGRYNILIAGHRRKRAIVKIAKDYGIEPEKISVVSSIRQGVSFEEALLVQLSENTYDEPRPTDIAKYIQQFYDYLLSKNGKKPTYKHIAARTGLSEYKVSNALRYCRLPDDVKDYVEKGLLPYSIAVRLAPFVEKYEKLHSALAKSEPAFGEDKEKFVENHTCAIATKIMKARLKRESQIEELIRNALKELDDQINGTQQGFELLPPPSSQASRDMSEKKLAATALAVLYNTAPNILSKQVDNIEGLLEKARNAARSADELPGPQQGGFDF